METYEIGKDNEDEDYGYIFLINRASTSNSNLHFKEDVYEGRLRDIDIYLNTLKRQES